MNENNRNRHHSAAAILPQGAPAERLSPLVHHLVDGVARRALEGDPAAIAKMARRSRAAENAALGALLAHRENAKLICWTLLRYGWPRQDVQDGRQDVYVKALESFQGKAPPDTLERMMALCAQIAKNHAIDQIRKAKTRKADLEAKCKREEYGWIEREPVARDPVDADRQLEVLADLFRKGLMPDRGVDILDGVVLGCTYGQIAEKIGISEELAKWRMREMKRIFRERLAKLGMHPGMNSLRLIVSKPAAITLLRKAA